MKKLILILISTTAFVTQMFSQDTLVLNSGKVILGKVEEIGSDQIKYKKPERMDGPLYVLNRSDVSSISYSNGTKEILSNEVQSPASSASNTVAVHVAGKDDQVIPMTQTRNTGIYGSNNQSNQVLNAVVLGAEMLAVGNLNRGMRRRSCGNPVYRRGGNAGLAVPIIIGLAGLVTHLK
jgi:hypothetical protein